MKKPQVRKNIGIFAREELGALFRRERDRRHLSQEEIAKRIGKSKTAVVYYEAGKRPIHFGTFVKLCSAIRVSPQFIIESWMEGQSFKLLDEERRKEYHDVIDEMIKYGFSAELDNLLIYFRGLINREKEIRKRISYKEQIQKEYYALKELHEQKNPDKKEGEGQGENGI